MGVKIDGVEQHGVRLFLDSIKKPGQSYEVLEFDTATERGCLVGSMGTPFYRVISKPELEKLGYKRRKVVENAEQP